MIINHDNRQKLPHPILTDVRQTAPNQILMIYDRKTDLASAINVSNYWIRSNVEHPIPPGIATEGMDFGLTDTNAVRPDVAIIAPINTSNISFAMTFRFNAIPGLVYIVLPCFVNIEGSQGYDSVNWGPFSRNMFIGM